MKIQNILLSELTVDRKSGLVWAMATVILMPADLLLAGGQETDLISFRVQQHFKEDANVQHLEQRLIDDARRLMGVMNFVEIQPVLTTV